MVLGKNLAIWLMLAISLTGCACSKASPPSPASSQTSPGSVESKTASANDSARHEPAAFPKVAPDGSPLFERFVGTACALSRAGEVWCPRPDLSQSLEYERMNYPAHVVRVAGAWPFNYLLTAQGQVFIAGKFVPTAPGAKEIDYSVPRPVQGLNDVIELGSFSGAVFALHKSGEVDTWRVEALSNEDVLTTGVTFTPREQVKPGGFDRMFVGTSGRCYAKGEQLMCENRADPLNTTRVDLPVPTADIATLWFSIGLCVASSKGTTHCWREGESILTNKTTEKGAELGYHEMPLQLKLIAGKPTAFFGVDVQNNLWTWSGPWKAPVKLERFGKVVDFDAYNTCVISVDGTLRCRSLSRGVGTGDQLEVNGVPGPVRYTKTPTSSQDANAPPKPLPKAERAAPSPAP